MTSYPSRRSFLKHTAAGTALLGLGDLGFISRLPDVSAAEAKLKPEIVRFSSNIEPLVRVLEETSRERLLEEIGARIRNGLSYRELLTALLLAGVRNIQPRPVGHKFHAVLVINSAHLASIASSNSERWLPIFWAIDYFKSSQAQDIREGDWTMAPPDEARIPSASHAREAFTHAMDNWDEEAADAAICGLVRTAGANEIFEILSRYGARDFRDIGHKAIYLANSWRTLQTVGWHHAEPVLRSLVYALLATEGESNPANSDKPADRPWRENKSIAGKINPGWQNGNRNPEATLELLSSFREATPAEASKKAMQLLNRQVAPQSIWDAIFAGGAELLMRRPGILSLHALTTTNALRFTFDNCANDETRRLLLLQNAAFLPLFRGDPSSLKAGKLDLLGESIGGSEQIQIEQIFAEISQDRNKAARSVLSYIKSNPDPREFIQAARQIVFLKGNNPHDYKFNAAISEDYLNLSREWRSRYLAASVYNLRGSGEADNELVKRTRAALVA